VGRVLATQFHPRKVAVIDTAPKGRMKRDHSAVACQKQELGLAHVAFIRNMTWKDVINIRHFHYRCLNHFNLAFNIPVSPLQPY